VSKKKQPTHFNAMKILTTSLLMLSLAASTALAQNSTSSSTTSSVKKVPVTKQAPAVATPPPAVNTPPPTVTSPPPSGATPPPAGNTAPPSGATPPPVPNTTPPGTVVQPGSYNQNQNIQPGVNDNVQSQFQQPLNSQLYNNHGAYGQNAYGQNRIATNGSGYSPNSLNNTAIPTNNLPSWRTNRFSTPGQNYPTNLPVQPRTLQH
jgi:hypothetical protein